MEPLLARLSAVSLESVRVKVEVVLAAAAEAAVAVCGQATHTKMVNPYPMRPSCAQLNHEIEGAYVRQLELLLELS